VDEAASSIIGQAIDSKPFVEDPPRARSGSRDRALGIGPPVAHVNHSKLAHRMPECPRRREIVERQSRRAARPRTSEMVSGAAGGAPRAAARAASTA